MYRTIIIILYYKELYTNYTIIKKFVASSKITTPYASSEENCISVFTQRVKRKLEQRV